MNAAPPSILLVVCDTLRRDALGAYGATAASATRPGTPHIDDLATRAQRFDAAFSAAPWTLPSVAAILTGRPTREHGARNAGEGKLTGIDPGLPTLAGILGQAGYRTGAVVTNPYLAPSFGLGRGFDDYVHLREPGRGRKVRGDRIVDTALDWLADGDDGPTFLLVHLFDPHMGYDPPGELRPQWLADEDDPDRALNLMLRELWDRERSASSPPEFRARVRELYDREVAFADAQVGRLLAALEQDGREWIVVFTSDHGEEFWDHGGFEHGHTLYDELVRVPLIIRWPANGATPRGGPVRTDMARHIDLAPTLLAAAGVPPPPGMAGRDLAQVASAPHSGTALVTNTLYGVERRALISGGMKLIHSEDGTVALFDLVADPRERADLAEAKPALVEALSAELERLSSGQRTAGAPVELDSDVVEELEALGYLR
ncbi:sulfatase [Engelhardtia mirabilis]|uniref:Arylsulfatase n=2 Tax=Engelhardtia mirabilis TaxID=2528011 RepID=A0A518BGD5_9BACT|nr:Arylsulfatase [Planctomycetes bacterium Pla133]QDV00375.1 Arylsulfatase [Planctomycetes bacterium Pla86]